MSEEKAQKQPQTQETKTKPTVLDEFGGDASAYLKSITKSSVKPKEPPEEKMLPEEKDAEPDEENGESPENVSLQSIEAGQKEPVKTYSKTELDARKKGWVPKDDYRGNPDDWVSAGQYLKTWSFINQLKTQDSTIKTLTKKLDDLINVQQTQSKIFVEKHAEELKQKVEKAFSEGNLEEFRKYDREYQTLISPSDNVQENVVIPKQNPSIPQEVVDFQQRNKWFNDTSPMNAAMTVYAKQLDQQLMQQQPHLSISERLAQVETSVQEQFGTSQNPVRDEYSSVEGKSRKYSKKLETVDFDYLPENVKQIVVSVVENSKGQITQEQCIKNFIKKGLIKTH